jgi:hypothetical protein
MRRLQMAKRQHPHRFMLIEKRIWKCMLPGCSYFVHLGLVSALYGKLGACWECGEEFVIDESALQDEMPKCVSCRTGVDLDSYIDAKLKLAKIQGVKPSKEKDEIEVIEPTTATEAEHAPDCGVYQGDDCTCR